MTHSGDHITSTNVARPDTVGNNSVALGSNTAGQGNSWPGGSEVPPQSEGLPDAAKTITALVNPGLPQTA